MSYRTHHIKRNVLENPGIYIHTEFPHVILHAWYVGRPHAHIILAQHAFLGNAAETMNMKLKKNTHKPHHFNMCRIIRHCHSSSALPPYEKNYQSMITRTETLCGTCPLDVASAIHITCPYSCVARARLRCVI